MDLKQFQSAFIDEASEHLESLENGLLQLEKNPDDQELLHAVFRDAHTIKGSSGAIGLSDVSRFTHIMEEILDDMRNANLRPDKGRVSTLLEAVDLLKEMVRSVAENRSFDFERCGCLMSRMEALKEKCQMPSEAPSPEGKERQPSQYLIRFRPLLEFFKQGHDQTVFFDKLMALGEIDSLVLNTDADPRLSGLALESFDLGWELSLRTDRGEDAIWEIFSFVKDDCEIDITHLKAPRVDIPLIGKLLAEEEVVSMEEEVACLSQKRLGEILVDQGKASKSDIDNALEKQAAQKAEWYKKAVSSSVRVDLDKLDTLVNLVGEMVIIHSMFRQLLKEQKDEGVSCGNSDRIDLVFSQLQRIGTNIQECSMSLRMLPVGDVFQRFTRLVRDLSMSRGKEVEMVISGEETELDKSVLEKIADPLVHLIRNAIDHGIETVEERLNLNKPPKATIFLRAYQMGNAVCIDVEDDGRGMDKLRIIEKALAQGIIDSATALSDDEVYNLIFLPGFSTTDTISDISGRGVGMDVVKKNIQALNGSVRITTRPGLGSTISLKLPLTLAIIEGFPVAIGSEVYIIPLMSVVESLRPARAEINSIEERGEVVNVRGEYIPLIRLHRILGIPGKYQDPCEAIIVVTQYDNRKFGFMVDELLGEMQVVLKNLGAATPRVCEISGGTIMGDGRVALVLDVAGVIETAMTG